MNLTAHTRRWIYGVALTVVPLLVAYGVLDDSAAPLWIALVGALVAPALALGNITPDGSGNETEEAAP